MVRMPEKPHTYLVNARETGVGGEPTVAGVDAWVRLSDHTGVRNHAWGRKRDASDDGDTVRVRVRGLSETRFIVGNLKYVYSQAT